MIYERYKENKPQQGGLTTFSAPQNDPNFEKFDSDRTPPEINFRLHPKEPQPMKGYPQEIEDKMFEPIIIPPNTCSISLEIAAGNNGYSA